MSKNMWNCRKLYFNLKQFTNTRQFRKYARVLARLVIIAIALWVLIFNIYALMYKLEDSIDVNKTTKKVNILNDTDDSNKKNGGSNKKDPFEMAKIIDHRSLEFFKKIQRPTYDVNCKLLIEWDEDEIRKAKRILFKLRNLNNDPDNSEKSGTSLIPSLSDSNFIFDESMCPLFRELRGYDNHQITDFEYKFPLAYIILTYNNVEQFERLLRAIYRPQNVYCIHIDSKSTPAFHEAIKSISRCFKNVFIATQLERIVYASYSRLKADINCMNDLTKFNYDHPNLRNKNFSTDWKYLINVASTEFPLRTNYELTRILYMFNGANDIEVMTNFQKERILYSWKIKKKANTSYEYIVRTKKLKTEIPHNYTIVKGIAYCSFSRQFVEYTLNNMYAKNLLKWSQDTYSPDEWYWATLQYNTQLNPPGGFRDPNRNSIPTRTRFIGWKNGYKCMGELRHNICVFSLEDLPELVTRHEFFANKFLLEFDPIGYQCMEEWLNSKISLHQTVDIIHYCRLLFVIPYSINPSCARLLNSKHNG